MRCPTWLRRTAAKARAETCHTLHSLANPAAWHRRPCMGSKGSLGHSAHPATWLPQPAQPCIGTCTSQWPAWAARAQPRHAPGLRCTSASHSSGLITPSLVRSISLNVCRVIMMNDCSVMLQNGSRTRRALIAVLGQVHLVERLRRTGCFALGLGRPSDDVEGQQGTGHLLSMKHAACHAAPPGKIRRPCPNTTTPKPSHSCPPGPRCRPAPPRPGPRPGCQPSAPPGHRLKGQGGRQRFRTGWRS